MPTTEQTIVLKIAVEFTKTPGPRSRAEGPFSGQMFREDVLERFFLRARSEGHRLLVDLDGGYGYATSFLEEAFGWLGAKYGPEAVNRVIELKSVEEPTLVDDVRKYISGRKKGY